MRLPHLSAAALALTVGASLPAAAQVQPGTLTDDERAIIRDVLDTVLGTEESVQQGNGPKTGLPPGLAKRDELPPGLANREQLPPGLAKRLDADLEARLTGRDVEITDDGLVIRDDATGAIVGVIRDLLTAGR